MKQLRKHVAFGRHLSRTLSFSALAPGLPKLAVRLSCAGLLLMLMVGPQAYAAQFNFLYRFEGERGILPLQVFDDGSKTYFQFRASNKVVPAILPEVQGSSYVANYNSVGPYVVVPGVASSYVLKYGSLTARIVQTGGRQTVAAPPPEMPLAGGGMVAVAQSVGPTTSVQRVVAYGPVNPILGAQTASESSTSQGSSVATRQTSGSFLVPFALSSSKLGPAGRRAIAQALKGNGEVLSVSIVGRDDVQFHDGVASGRADAIYEALIRYGIAAGRISRKIGVPREGDDPKNPTSDLLIVRAEPAAGGAGQPDGAARSEQGPAGDAAAVASAVGMVREGLTRLVRLNALTSSRLDAVMDILNRGLPTFQRRDERAPGRRQQDVKASVSAEQPAVQSSELWAMGPPDEWMRKGLAKWAAREGLTLDWRAGVDYPLRDWVKVQGTGDQAVAFLVGLTKGQKQPLQYRREDGKLIIEEKSKEP